MATWNTVAENTATNLGKTEGEEGHVGKGFDDTQVCSAVFKKGKRDPLW